MTDLEAQLGVVVRRSSHIFHDKDRLKPTYVPATVGDHLFVALGIQPVQADGADLNLAVRVQLNGRFTGLATTRTGGGRHPRKLVHDSAFSHGNDEWLHLLRRVNAQYRETNLECARGEVAERETLFA
jgi:hypothetical protein